MLEFFKSILEVCKTDPMPTLVGCLLICVVMLTIAVDTALKDMDSHWQEVFRTSCTEYGGVTKRITKYSEQTRTCYVKINENWYTLEQVRGE